MKKILAFIIVITGFLTITDMSARTSFGLKTGLNIANLTGKDVDIVAEGLKSKLGINGGVFVNLGISNVFSIQPELLYSQKGWKIEIEDKGDMFGNNYTIFYSGIYKYNYIDIPVLVVLSIPVSENFTPKLFLGPSLGINLSAKGKLSIKVDYSQELEEHGFTDYEEDDEADLKEFTKTTDYGLVTGVNFEISGFIIEARYSLSLNTFFALEEGEEYDIRNSVVSIMIGYSFSSRKSLVKEKKSETGEKTIPTEEKITPEIPTEPKVDKLTEWEFNEFRKKLQIKDCIEKINAYLDTKEYDKAREEIQKALNLDPKNDKIKQLCARVIEGYIEKSNSYIETQEYNKAKEEVQKALKLNLENNEAKQILERINDVINLLGE